ncbi:MAG: EamA family transporter RarD [Sphingomicrobium sp.]
MNTSTTPRSSPTSAAGAPNERLGFAYGLLAYAAWGLIPIYFKLLQSVASVTIVAFRILFSLIFLVVLVTLARGWPKVRAALGHRRTTALLMSSAALIAVNWLLYVYAVNSRQILAASLGYYLNPLANILLGRLFLDERLSRLQWTAVALAAAGIAVLAVGALGQLWISLLLCVSFSIYGFVRKIVAADALTGLGVETGLLAPVALGWLLFAHMPGAPLIAPTQHVSLLLVFSGVVSTLPLLLFTAAARRLPYSTMGMLQFIAPTLQFLVAVLIYGESFSRAHAVAFAAIWSALALYCFALVSAAPRPVEVRSRHGHVSRVLNLVSIIIGVVAFLFALVAFVPFLGWLNWLIIPLALVGSVIGAASASSSGRNLNLFVIVVGVLRLMLGGGIF